MYVTLTHTQTQSHKHEHTIRKQRDKYAPKLYRDAFVITQINAK